jgi:D-alanyl-D-alanine carboxypeptidase
LKVVADLDALAEAARVSGAPGVVLARRDAGKTSCGSAGTADIEACSPIDSASQFYVASVGKTFLGSVVLALVHEGQLDLDEPVDSYLSDVGPIHEGVQLRHLLQHTSGLRDFYGEPEFFEATRENPGHRWAFNDLLELVLSGSSEPPGTRWSYSTTNYLLLWLVLEHVGGTSAPDLFRRRITEPLGLHDTSLGRPVAEKLARGYMPADNALLPGGHGLVDASELTPTLAYPDATVSTPADVTCFLEALLDGTLLPPILRRQLLAAVPADGVECDAYGLGIARTSSFFGTSPSPCGPAWGHLGLAPGYTTIALSREDGSRQVVLAANIGLIGADAWHPLAEAAWSAFCQGESVGKPR